MIQQSERGRERGQKAERGKYSFWRQTAVVDFRATAVSVEHRFDNSCMLNDIVSNPPGTVRVLSNGWQPVSLIKSSSAIERGPKVKARSNGHATLLTGLWPRGKKQNGVVNQTFSLGETTLLLQQRNQHSANMWIGCTNKACARRMHDESRACKWHVQHSRRN